MTSQGLRTSVAKLNSEQNQQTDSVTSQEKVVFTTIQQQKVQTEGAMREVPT